MNKAFFNREIITTADGSSSIYLPDFGEHYHSVHGAVRESLHVFMNAGWEKIVPGKSHIDILEVGFGSGLNAWLVYDTVVNSFAAPSVHYSTLELYPVAVADALQLNYVDEKRREEFINLHRAEWNSGISMNKRFVLEKLQVSVQEFEAGRKYDLIFFDAFAPRVQPEMWTQEVFGKMYALMKPGGILVTYCAKGEVRRNMIAAGFSVEKLPGPPGKREMLRARAVH